MRFLSFFPARSSNAVRTMRWLGHAVTFSSVALVAGLMLGLIFEKSAIVAFEAKTATPVIMQVFFDTGAGFREPDSAAVLLPGSGAWEKVQFPFSSRKLRGIRLDPSRNDTAVSIRRLTIVSPEGDLLLDSEKPKLHALNQVEEIRDEQSHVTIVPTRGAYDPYVEVLMSPITVAKSAIRLGRSLWLAVLAGASVLLVVLLSRTLAWRRWSRRLGEKPYAAIALTGIAAGVLSCAAVVFSGKSFLSPSNGDVPLLYESPPTLPGYGVRSAEQVYGSDVGAMAWQHFTYTLLQERAVKIDGELPLWNRFNGGGRTLIGQGQSMLGDPLNWLIWAVGTNSAPYDIKFVVLRIIFATAVGFCVYMLGGSLSAAIIAGGASPFITYFLHRLNHPASFSLCYAPLLLLAWIGLSRASIERVRWWMLAVVGANWLLLNSGTAKEAYMLALVLNATGMALIFVAPSGTIASRFRRFSVAALALVCFAAISIPIWGMLRETVSHGFTVYLAPSVSQFSVASLLGFSDNLFFLLRDQRYWPAMNMILFLGMLTALVSLGGSGSGAHRDLASARVLVAALGACIALAFGVVPASLLVKIPIINSIHHIDGTFSTVALVPASVLGGLGLSYLTRVDRVQLRRAGLKVAAVLLAMTVLFLSTPHTPDGKIVAYVIVWSCASALVIGILRRPSDQAMSPAVLAVLALSLAILVARGTAWGQTAPRFDRWVFNPKERVDLLVESEVVRMVRENIREPTRVISVGNSVHSGYRAQLGFESIDGADALEGRRYRELTNALQLPYHEWNWRMEFTRESLRQYRRELDFLNVGLVFSSGPLDKVDYLSEVASEPRLRAYRRAGDWPRAFFSDQVMAVSDLTSLGAMVRSAPAPFVGIDAVTLASSTDLQSLVRAKGYSASILPASAYHLSTNTTIFNVQANGAGVVYLGESDEPGDFIVHVNGVRSNYFPANHAFKAIYIPKAGSYEVVVRYWPARLDIYLMIAALGFAALCGLFVWSGRTSRVSASA